MCFLEDINMNQALVTYLLGLILSQERKGSEENLSVNSGVKCADIFANIWNMYGIIREAGMSENLGMMKKQWDKANQ